MSEKTELWAVNIHGPDDVFAVIPSLLTPGQSYPVHSVTRGPAGRVWLSVLSDMGTTESIESDYFEGRWGERPDDRGELYLTAPIDEAGYIDFSFPKDPRS